jgi:hypothetical protein
MREEIAWDKGEVHVQTKSAQREWQEMLQHMDGVDLSGFKI